MNPSPLERAQDIRSRLLGSELTPAAFRAALISVPVVERDGWVDQVLGLDTIPDDGPDLPQGCVPYLPCPVDALLRLVDQAEVQEDDVFVDVGAGVGRAALLVHLLTGASAIGVEVQRSLFDASRELAQRLKVTRFSPLHGDAVLHARSLSSGSVFFLYCPFGRERLERFVDELEPVARKRPIRVCSLDAPLPSRAWLTPSVSPGGDLAICRSILGTRISARRG